MQRRLAQQWMTLSDLEWLFHSSSVPSVWKGRANVNAPCISFHTKINIIRIMNYLCDS